MTNISQKDNQIKKLKDKKILYIVTQSKWGGAQKYILDLVRYFSKKNTVTVAYGEKDNIDKFFTKKLEELNVKTILVPYLYRAIDISRDYLALMEIVKIYNQGKYDLVHLNSSKAGLLGSLAAKMYSLNLLNTRLRLIYTAHGFVFNEPLSKFKKKIYKFSEKIAASIENIIITVSKADRQSAIDHKIIYPHKIIAIHNGIDTDNVHFYTREEALEKLSLDKNKKYFVTIANFYKTKGYKHLIEAIKILKNENHNLLLDYQWVLIGNGPELENIKNLISENKLDKYFKLLGAKDKAYKYLKAFDFFILPSVKEGLPYVLLEAGLSKIPIIATKVGGVEEIIEDKKTGLLIPPADPMFLAQVIKNLKTIDTNTIIEKNYQNIKNNFNLKKTLTKTEEVYTKLF